MPEVGRAWIDTLPPETCSPWTIQSDPYAEEHVRLRICLVPGIDCFTCVGAERTILGVGVVNLVDHTKLSCEMNLGQHSRTHLVVDLRKPDDLSEEG